MPKHLPKDAAWAAAFDRLVAHLNDGGSLSTSPSDDDETAMMHWVAANMRAYQQGTLSAVKARLLETIPGWTWTLTEPPGDTWPLRYRQLSRFLTKHERYPFRFHPKEGDLASWVEEQRDAFPEISEERIRLLERLNGWTWAPPSDEQAAVSRYARFLTTRGRHPRNYHNSDEEKALYSWAKKKRAAHGRGELPDDEVELLSGIPGWRWDGPPR